MNVGAWVWQMLGVLMIVSVFVSCEHRPLEDPYNAHYVRVYVDEHIKNVTYGFYDETREKPQYYRPRVMRAVLADAETGEVVSERFLQTSGEDERGYYIDGYIAAEAGNYDLLIYNFGTERTVISNEYKYNQMQATTLPIPKSFYQYFPTIQEEIDKNTIRYCPDHLFLSTCQRIKVKPSVGVDTLYNADGDFFTAKSVVKSYYLQIKILGFEYVSTAVSLLSGMAGSVTLSTKQMDYSDPVNVFFDMDYAEVARTKDGESKSAVLYATFNTFGKLPEEQNVYTMNFEFTRTDGTSQLETIDITSMFDEPLVKDEQWIIIPKIIEITPTVGGGGGLQPGVDEWGDVWSDIQL